MARRLPNLLTALSLLLCVAASVQWVRSYRIGEFWHWYNRGRGSERGLASRHGAFSFYQAWWDPYANLEEEARQAKGAPAELGYRPPPSPNEPTEFKYSAFPNPPDFTGKVQFLKSKKDTRAYGPRLGLGVFLSLPGEYGTYHVEVLVPYWLVVAATAAAPALWLRRRRRRPRGPNFCTTCSYNLTGNTSGVCPECGTAVAPR